MSNKLLLSEVAGKHYDTLQKIVYDLAAKCLGEEEVTLHFAVGSVTIRLK